MTDTPSNGPSSKKRTVYLTLVLLLALFVTSPLILMFGMPVVTSVVDVWRGVPITSFLLPLPGVVRVNCANDNLVRSSFWRDGFVEVETLGQWAPNTGIHFKITTLDPETGRRSSIEGLEDILASSYPTNFEFGRRLFIETSGGMFEYVDSTSLTPLTDGQS